MAKITITTDSKSVTVNGRVRQLGYFGFDVVDGEVSILGAGVKADLADVDLNGTTYATEDELIAALQAAAFKSGGSGPGPEPGDAVWGGITGTLSNQTDLANVLAGKANTSDLSDIATSGSYNDLDDVPASFPPSSHTHTASQISDSTTVGRNVLTAADAAAARAAIGAGTSSQNLSVPSQSEVETGTATTARSITAQQLRQAADAAIAASDKISSVQELGVGGLVLNILTFPNGQLPDIGDRVPGTLYIEEEA